MMPNFYVPSKSMSLRIFFPCRELLEVLRWDETFEYFLQFLSLGLSFGSPFGSPLARLWHEG